MLAQIGSEGLTHREMTLVGTIASEGRAIVVAVNKIDLLDAAARKQVRPTGLLCLTVQRLSFPGLQCALPACLAP